MMEIPIHDLSGKVVEKVQFDESCLGKAVYKALLHQAIVTFEANQRQGTASSLTRSEVMGSGAKPWRQKGTGRARVGTKRNPIWRGGGIAHGPKPRDYRKKFAKQQRRIALKSALLAKFRAGEVKVVTDFAPAEPKTKPMAAALQALGVAQGCLVVLPAHNEAAWKSVRNIPQVDMTVLRDMNAYETLLRRHILMTKEVLAALPREMQ